MMFVVMVISPGLVWDYLLSSILSPEAQDLGLKLSCHVVQFSLKLSGSQNAKILNRIELQVCASQKDLPDVSNSDYTILAITVTVMCR